MNIRATFRHIAVAAVLVVHLVASPAFAQRADERFYLPWNAPPEDAPTSFRRGGDPASSGQHPASRVLDTPAASDGVRAMFDTSGMAYQVHLVGEVMRPATYRIMASDRLQEVLQRAGGVLPQGSQRYIEVRQKGTKSKTYDLLRFQLQGDLRQNPFLQDNDVVFVPLRKSAVQVVGSVKRPNTYELRGEHTLADMLALAGGPTVGAATSVPLRMIRFVDGEKKVFEIPNDPAQTRITEVENGDVVYVPNVLSANRAFDYNIARLPGDNIFYPSYEDRVFVLGGVNNPGPYPFNPYGTVNQYLTIAGGTTKLARVNRLEVITMGGEKRKIHRNQESVINPGDTIFVPEPRIAPEGWLGIVTSLAGFGLSATATILTLSR